MSASDLNILVKFPTKNRGLKFFQVLTQYVQSCKEPTRVKYLVTIDDDDHTMSDEIIKACVDVVGKDSIHFDAGYSANKIHACNRGMNECPFEWDVVVLASDDMIPQVNGWDQIIVDQMSQSFPELNGCLWFYDGHQNAICTMSIIGRAYYETFHYLYHSSYVSLWCDNEFTEVAQKTGSIVYSSTCLFRHMHPVWERKADLNDALYRKNESYFGQDKRNYILRKKRGFPV